MENKIMVKAMMKMERLSILKFYFIPDLVIVPTVRVDFEYVAGWFGWNISRAPGFGDDFVHDRHVRIDPDHVQVEWDK